MSETRWTDSKGYSDISVAVDEIYDLRALCAHVAEEVSSTLELRGLAAFRRERLVELRDALVAGACGDPVAPLGDRKAALRAVGADDCLTNHQWAEQRNLVPVAQVEGECQPNERGAAT